MRDLDENHLFINSTRYPPSYESVQQWLRHEVDEWNKKYIYIDSAIASLEDMGQATN